VASTSPVLVLMVLVLMVLVLMMMLLLLLIDIPFPAFIIQSYGSVLSPLAGANEQGNLSRTLGSVVGVACLRAEGRVGPQLTSHVFGLLKARSIEGLSEEDRWLASDEGAEWVIRTVDTLLNVIIAERG